MAASRASSLAGAVWTGKSREWKNQKFSDVGFRSDGRVVRIVAKRFKGAGLVYAQRGRVRLRGHPSAYPDPV